MIAGTTQQLSEIFQLNPVTLGMTVFVELAGTVIGALGSGILGQKPVGEVRRIGRSGTPFGLAAFKCGQSVISVKCPD